MQVVQTPGLPPNHGRMNLLITGCKDGTYNYVGATGYDLQLMRENAGDTMQVKASGGIRTLSELLAAKALGATRIGASATVAMMEEAKKRFGIASDVVVKPQETQGY